MSESIEYFEQNSLDNLPDEIWMEVFDYLSGKELKVTMFVCRRWHQIITQSASLMRKLPFNFTFYKINPGRITHNFHTARILNESLHGIELLNVDFFQEVDITNNSFELISLKNLMRSFQNLQCLSLSSVKINDSVLSDNSNIDHVNFKLKQLKLIQTDHKVLDALQSYQVRHLEIIDSSNKCNEDSLNEFLQYQSCLEILVIEQLQRNASLFNGKEYSYNYKFKLKRFSALFCNNYEHTSVFKRNFNRFLSLQSCNIISLKIEGPLPSSTFELIVSNKFCNLNSLEINPCRLPHKKSFYDGLKTNERLKCLKLTSTVTRENFESVHEFFNVHRGIGKLFLIDTDEHVANNLYYVISNKLKNLTHLSVLNFDHNFEPNFVIEKLKIFSIRILNNIDQWLSFVLLHKELSSISVGWFQRDFDTEIIRKLVDHSTVQHMDFGGRFIANKKIYNAIKSDYKNVRTLILRVSNYDEVKHLKFIFPLNRDNFNPKCSYFEENNDREPLND